MDRRNVLRAGSLFLLLLLLLPGVCGRSCSASGAGEAAGRRVVTLEAADLAGKRIGVMTGSPQDRTVEAVVSDPVLFYFENNPDEALALDSGKIDSFVCVDEIFRYMQPEHPELAESTLVYDTYRAGVIFQKTPGGELLRDQMNAYLAELTASGEMERLRGYWFSPGAKEPVDLPQTGENGVLSGAVTTSIPPYSYLLEGKRAGFDIALLDGFCRRWGYGVRLDEANYGGMVTGIVSSRYDLCISVIAWTKERAESVLFSDIYLQYDMIAVVRADDWPEGAAAAAVSSGSGAGSLPARLRRSFERTLLEEGRWRILLDGAAATLLISLCSFLLANLAGTLFCAMALSRRRGLRLMAEAYSALMQGTPMVTVLMILYYVVFGHSDLPGTVIAILGFGIVSGAYLMEVFRGGITGVDAGQREAALALGMTKGRAFAGIVLPQAVRRMLPGYFSQLISLIKGTSVVGYIAVVDLTRAGDLIRSTTFEAFFPILVPAVCYFALSSVLLMLMRRIAGRLAPVRRGAPGKGEDA